MHEYGKKSAYVSFVGDTQNRPKNNILGTNIIIGEKLFPYGIKYIRWMNLLS